MNTRSLIAMMLALASMIAGAQSPIYQSTGKEGPVFSDQPSPGAKQLELPAPNIIEGPKLPPPQAEAPAAAPLPYSQLMILEPAEGGTLWTNTGDFDLQVQARPALQTRRGDAFRVKIDGNALAPAFSGESISISAAHWARAEATDNVLHSLQVAIVDRSGAVLIESAPIQFYLRRHTLPPKVAPR